MDLGVLAEQTCFSGKRPSEKTTIASTFRLNSQVLHFHLHGKENYQFDCGFTYYAPINSKLQHPTPGIPRAFDCASCPGRGEFERSVGRVGNLNRIYLLF